MPTLNNDQWKSALTSALMLLGMYLAASGKVTPAQWSALSANIMDTVLGLVSLGLAIYKLYQHADSKVTLAASAVPGVQVTANPAAASMAVMSVALDPTNAVKVTV